ncbi:hypothetical protein EV217_1935 [Phyllobacterium myrsinacearum]|uniref:hypothetical protein n=1 Tax=Phyllobacterium myrsinacearum TaxID=28101 RepID=UPI0010EB2F96|nr:hypothetical protein [Phyllobacterium myrsinacearum]RZS83195.1 hypothetical protein EV217_1935 [Phyllobacterium myrsinacearum]
MSYFKYIIAAITVLFTSNTYAGTGSGLIRNIDVINEVVFFYVDKTVGDPACTSSRPTPKGFVFDGSTINGKNMLALLLAAANGKKLVTVYGSNNCSLVQDRETASWFDVAY